MLDQYKPSTAGERLYLYIYKQLEDERSWRHLQNTLRPIGDCDKLVSYYRQHAAMHLTCKLISAGKCFASELDTDDGENTSVLFPIIEQHPWNRINESNRLLRLLSTSVRQANREIGHGVKKAMRTFAREQHDHCYLCGNTLDFSDAGSDLQYSAEHLWPSSYGGDSVEENLLPACSQCNSAKGRVASWVSTDVHALFLGINPKPDKLETIPFKQRYALFHRVAFSVAVANGISLKEAFLKLGPMKEVRVHDVDLAADMFNLKTHLDNEELITYENV